MSNHYIVAWDARHHGMPKDFAVAGEQAARLLTQEEGPSAGLQSFAEEVAAYLQNCGEEGWQQFLWDLPGRAKGNGRAAMRIEMPYEDWQHILVKMVEVAAKHQVVLYNENLVMVFLPSGQVLPAARNKIWQGLQAAWSAGSEFPQTKGQFKKWFDPQFDTVLARHGNFVKDKNPWENRLVAFIRDGDFCKQYISYICDNYDGVLNVEVSLRVSCKAVQEICQHFKFFGEDTVFSADLFFRVLKWPTERRDISSFQDADRWLNAMEEALFPAMDLACTIQGLDLLLNGEADTRYRDHFHNYVFKPQCLIVARLAGNPRFEELVEELSVETGWHANASVRKTEWPRLVQYLREEVKPIV
ncbi:hypothetical protein EV700_1329 [Fluviicoccus keumensis]|uniref:Uncharacterized protein n=1 Tax=Fluviicoccus keumensis TaxID=1435465 RepID=A0A4Q7ZAL9_9GAMM|nr:hypothetical protein [Fluviicoccus keumensis]RZU46943.1 hypothetical protein EV700_1329 [Fluviicoccus keumensis]